MKRGNRHLSDESLLLAADGELRSWRAAPFRAHLASCPDCRARMAEIQISLADFVRASRQAVDPQLPPRGRARLLLRAQLEQIARRGQGGGWAPRFFRAKGRSFAFVFAVVIIAALIVRTPYEHARRGESTEPHSAYSQPLPNPILTPGSVRTTRLSEICLETHEQVVRRVPIRVQQQVFREYGMENVRTEDYEVDHLITPGLGGSDDIGNLWPEPHSNTEWNSYVKDQLEEHLHRLVCGRQLTLVRAQRDIASNWIAAYKKYFHSDAPLPNDPAFGEGVPGASQPVRHEHAHTGLNGGNALQSETPDSLLGESVALVILGQVAARSDPRLARDITFR